MCFESHSAITRTVCLKLATLNVQWIRTAAPVEAAVAASRSFFSHTQSRAHVHIHIALDVRRWKLRPPVAVVPAVGLCLCDEALLF